jgi:hypothetical protein
MCVFGEVCAGSGRLIRGSGRRKKENSVGSMGKKVDCCSRWFPGLFSIAGHIRQNLGKGRSSRRA